jgi:hypothetical protein
MALLPATRRDYLRALLALLNLAVRPGCCTLALACALGLDAGTSARAAVFLVG